MNSKIRASTILRAFLLLCLFAQSSRWASCADQISDDIQDLQKSDELALRLVSFDLFEEDESDTGSRIYQTKRVGLRDLENSPETPNSTENTSSTRKNIVSNFGGAQKSAGRGRSNSVNVSSKKRKEHELPGSEASCSLRKPKKNSDSTDRNYTQNSGNEQPKKLKYRIMPVKPDHQDFKSPQYNLSSIPGPSRPRRLRSNSCVGAGTSVSFKSQESLSENLKKLLGVKEALDSGMNTWKALSKELVTQKEYFDVLYPNTDQGCSKCVKSISSESKKLGTDLVRMKAIIDGYIDKGEPFLEHTNSYIKKLCLDSTKTLSPQKLRILDDSIVKEINSLMETNMRMSVKTQKFNRVVSRLGVAMICETTSYIMTPGKHE
jgi:hypothetical protein